MEQNDENPSSQTQSEHELVVRIEVSKKNRNISTKISKEKSERLKSAWVAVKECSMTLYAAAKKYDVPVSTLWDWCQRNDIIDQLPVVGRPCFLGTALEDKLKEWIFEAAQTGFPINSAQLMFEAKRYNERHSIVDGWEPGPKWFRGFKRRNKDISLRIPQYMSPKKFSLTENQIREWFTKVSEYLESTCQDVLDDPNRIFNVDETSFCVNPKLGKVLVKRGTKNVYNLTMDNEKDCYTALIGVCAPKPYTVESNVIVTAERATYNIVLQNRKLSKMNTIFSVVLLKDLQRKIVVKSEWIEYPKNASLLNIGVTRYDKRKVFYSLEDKPANFSLPISTDFNETDDACYEGYVLKSFDHKHFADFYNRRKRNVPPVNYSEKKRRTFRDNEIEFKVERMNKMQSTITRLNNFIGTLGVHDLTEDEVSETIALLLAAGDDIRTNEDRGQIIEKDAQVTPTIEATVKSIAVDGAHSSKRSTSDIALNEIDPKQSIATSVATEQIEKSGTDNSNHGNRIGSSSNEIDTNKSIATLVVTEQIEKSGTDNSNHGDRIGSSLNEIDVSGTVAVSAAADTNLMIAHNSNHTKKKDQSNDKNDDSVATQHLKSHNKMIYKRNDSNSGDQLTVKTGNSSHVAKKTEKGLIGVDKVVVASASVDASKITATQNTPLSSNQKENRVEVLIARASRDGKQIGSSIAHSNVQFNTDFTFSLNNEFIDLNESGDRKYIESGIVFKKHILKLLKRMNEDKEFNGMNGDKAFVETMMKVACQDELQSGRAIGPKKLALMKDLFGVRTLFDETRTSRFDSLVNNRLRGDKN